MCEVSQAGISGRSSGWVVLDEVGAHLRCPSSYWITRGPLGADQIVEVVVPTRLTELSQHSDDPAGRLCVDESLAERVAVGLQPVTDIPCHCEQRHEIVAEPSPQVFVSRKSAAMG